MGVEYRHFLVVDDENWHPEPDTFERVNEVLKSWGLHGKLLEVVDLAGGKPRTTSDSTVPKGLAGKAFRIEGQDGAVVARLAGPSLYDCEDEDRYLMQILVILGEDFRIHWSSEGFFFELAEPPSVAYQDEEPFEIAYSESVPATNAAPPKVKVHIEDFARKHIASKDYKGFWRAAVILEFGKDLPAFADGVHSLPSKEFLQALQNALRAQSINEIGEFY